MNPHDFLEVANEWITGVREAEWRSAVSRAYYAAFHVARLLLERCGFSVCPEASAGFFPRKLQQRRNQNANSMMRERAFASENGPRT